MSGTEDTLGYTAEDARALVQEEARKHGGRVPADSEAALAQSLVDRAGKDKASLIAERQANLPLPDDPPVPSDWNSADGRKVNVGSGGVESDITYGDGNSSGLRGPATGDSSVRTDGDAFGVNTAGADVGRGQGGKVPSDAVTGDKRDAAGVTETRNKDYGYPEKSDPSSGL